MIKRAVATETKPHQIRLLSTGKLQFFNIILFLPFNLKKWLHRTIKRKTILFIFSSFDFAFFLYLFFSRETLSPPLHISLIDILIRHNKQPSDPNNKNAWIRIFFSGKQTENGRKQRKKRINKNVNKELKPQWIVKSEIKEDRRRIIKKS